MACPYLAYRTQAGDAQFDEARAYCTAADRFVQAMRADICNDRYGLAHDEHCEIYLGCADKGGGGADERRDRSGGNP
ncbi:hypothetical protein [Natrialba sp. INN-245]|uniref:hypothetical protein n=1 Tax=Natrialba sp. INN-245 TaxID=2690967 RepID=UPI00131070CB|nr:hypothetical protein [Natrialba sp. INN-245]MWV39297.1 hypothetical protein [Natrialba sp. INN-245]